MSADWFPLWLSLGVAAVATALSLPPGLWLACRLRRGGEGWRMAVAMPPTVLLGWAAALLLGEGSLVLGWKAAVAAGMCEGVLLAALVGRAALDEVHPSQERAARSLGASEWRLFWRVSLPLAWGPLLASALAVFARVLGDFGLTLIVAGFAVGRGGMLDASVRPAVEGAGGGAARLTAVALAAVLIAVAVLAGRAPRRTAA
jgi:molybdate transport system permease protein